MSIGILGGGQLARMLIQEGQKMGLDLKPHCKTPAEPAAQVCSNFALGDIKSFIRMQEMITFESEFVDCEELKNSHAHYFPKLAIMQQLQDRKSQKELLDKYKIATSKWHIPTDELPGASKKWVLKQRRNGYDGYGTHFVKNQKEWDVFFQYKKNEEYIAEEFIPFKRELASLFYRSRNGSTGHFPLVEWKAKDAKCFWVKGPVKHRNFDAIKKPILKMMKNEDYVGLMAVEFFESAGKLLVNEVAPRVHNSGHYSLNAMTLNQFRIHLLCLMGENLPKSIEADVPAFAMVNLIGKSTDTPKWKEPTGAHLHWYGKSENRPGRKMGHLNTTGKTPAEALKKALMNEKRFQL